ncbi:MAG: hypothetical protein J0M18_19300 [Ignavibacteria bacterium]|nr:hypothetical protein [Ignavibacteria bacterium]
MEHENEHLDIREKLLRLPKLQADENFLKRLQIQIDILDSEERTRDVVVKGTASSYFKNLFGARFVPALGISSIVVAAFLVYFILGDKKDAVVTNMTGNKNTETVITKEEPGITNSLPTTENKELAKKEDTYTKDKVVTKTQETQKEYSEEFTGKSSVQPKVIEEKITTLAPTSDIKSNTAIDADKSGRMIEQKINPITQNERKTTDKLKDAESKKETIKTESPTASMDQEKTINEGGRGKSDTNTSKNPQSSPKPKKKTVDGVIDINKSVLESLRDKLK